MVFMPGKALQAGIIVSFSLLFVCIAAFSERNATDSASGDGVVTSIPFPGPDWIERMGTPENKLTLENGDSYSSAFG
eukprot:CAMPEP_0117005810 /NCGR_PEP_ID=MMETSP0472-20121206/6271_1 /TAXON_ID=693140 ORGANISM="Tiarina fusus, Strain LIS" /NCGR_SAMPLE_ID=MMETSP0472 /ASSEMBLY_ACC=CAM_ASM_000603 /LENGTH=76 /DNA_ID=CAMNT_0004707113 /DNA_START=35 /DNA_END=261 /DNA_ORIENTATION=+